MCTKPRHFDGSSVLPKAKFFLKPTGNILSVSRLTPFPEKRNNFLKRNMVVYFSTSTGYQKTSDRTKTLLGPPIVIF